MKYVLILILIVCSIGCASGNKAAGNTETLLERGTWTVSGNLQCASCGSSGVASVYTAAFVPSPCTVITPVGSFSVSGPACYVANNNTGEGAITGKGIPKSTKGAGHGVLIGVPSNPVPANAAVNIVFVAADKYGNLVEFTGSGKVVNGNMTGTVSCSPNTPICHGASATFSGIQQ
jgi:hypothetical protein